MIVFTPASPAGQRLRGADEGERPVAAEDIFQRVVHLLHLQIAHDVFEQREIGLRRGEHRALIHRAQQAVDHLGGRRRVGRVGIALEERAELGDDLVDFVLLRPRS